MQIYFEISDDPGWVQIICRRCGFYLINAQVEVLAALKITKEQAFIATVTSHKCGRI